MFRKVAVATLVGIAIVGVLVGTTVSRGGGGRGAGQERGRRNDGRPAMERGRGRGAGPGVRQGRGRENGRGRRMKQGRGRGGRGTRGKRGQRGRGKGRQQSYVQRRMQMVRRRLRAGQQEWRSIAEPLEEVVTLTRFVDPEQALDRAALRSPALQTRDELQELVRARLRLRQALGNGEAGSDQINQMLRELRRRRERVRRELEDAEKRLQLEVTPRQEAHLVLMGLLD